MLQSDRKTEATRQSAQEKEPARRQQNREKQTSAAQALEAILSGGSWEQLPAEGMLALSHTLGNDALLELTALRNAGPETGTGSLPAGFCTTAPLDLSIGEPLTADAPDFGAMAPMGEAAPLAL